MIENHSFSYPTWGKLLSNKYRLSRKLLLLFNKSASIFNTYSRKYLGEVTTSVGISLFNTPTPKK